MMLKVKETDDGGCWCCCAGQHPSFAYTCFNVLLKSSILKYKLAQAPKTKLCEEDHRYSN